MRGGGLLNRSTASLCACCRRHGLHPHARPLFARQVQVQVQDQARLQSTFPSSAADRDPTARNGNVGDASSPRAALSSSQWPSAQSGWGATFGSTFGSTPAEGGKQRSLSSYDDDLLPHERAARNRARKDSQQAAGLKPQSSTPSNSANNNNNKPAAPLDDLLPHERAAKDRARQGSSRPPLGNSSEGVRRESRPRPGGDQEELGGDSYRQRRPPHYDEARRPQRFDSARWHEHEEPRQRGAAHSSSYGYGYGHRHGHKNWDSSHHQQPREHVPGFSGGGRSVASSESGRNTYNTNTNRNTAETASDPGNENGIPEWGQLTRRRQEQRPFHQQQEGREGLDSFSRPQQNYNYNSANRGGRKFDWDRTADQQQQYQKGATDRSPRNNGSDFWAQAKERFQPSSSSSRMENETSTVSEASDAAGGKTEDPWAALESSVEKSRTSSSKTQPSERLERSERSNERPRMQQAEATDERRSDRRNGEFAGSHAAQERKAYYRERSERDRDRERNQPAEWKSERDRVDKPKSKPAKSRRRSSSSRGEDEEDDNYYDDEGAEQRRRLKEERKAEKERQKQLALEAAAATAGPKTITLPQFISVASLSGALGVKGDEFVGQLGELGFENIALESIMTGETAALVAQEYGFEPVVDAGEAEDLKARPVPSASEAAALPLRPPVVTIMGHVDHGKTTLLDWLRKSSVAAQEHGGITQHIGAFSVRMSTGKQITFLDTPGHAAFLTMRQRGANITDMVVLVVAADDSVMPQTLEALRHARAARVPIIVAINKIDKDEARPDQVKSDLARHGVELEDYGGDVPAVCVSGRTGQGMDSLEETVLLLSDILDIRAEPDGPAEGWVLESSVRPTGRAATVLVKRGTLRKGDYVVAGPVWSKVRSMRNEAGVEMDEAPPGTPVEILGWRDPPAAGDMVLQAPDEARAKAAVRWRLEQLEREKDVAEMVKQEEEKRRREAEEAAAARAAKYNNNPSNTTQSQTADAATTSNTTTPTGDETPAGPQIINFTVKGDVHGSVEAVSAAILELGNGEVRPRILAAGTGQINESDVEYAAAAGRAHIVNFNTAIPGPVKRMAEAAGVRILDHNVIYHLADEARALLSDMLPPLVTFRVLGEVEVLQVFKFNVRGRVFRNVAGCRVRNGAVTRNATCRVLRRGEKIFEGMLDGLKQGKKDVAEMRKGTECGISFADWEDFREGDQIQVIEEVREKRKL